MDYTGKDNIEVEGHIGTWYTIDTTTIKDKQFFLLEHEEYGDETSALIIDTDGKLILDDVWNGFDDLDEHFDYLAMNGNTNNMAEFTPEQKLKYEENTNEVAYKYNDVSIYAKVVDAGIDSSLYDKNLKLFGGGIYDKENITMTEVINSIAEDFGLESLRERTSEMIDVAELLERVNLAEEQRADPKKNADQVAYKMGDYYLYVQSVDDGFDFTVYDKNLNSLDGGVYDDPTITMSEAVTNIREDLGNDIKSLQLSVAEQIDVSEFLEKVESAEEQQATTRFLDQSFERNAENAYAIYQLKDNDNTRGFRFEGIAHLERNDVEIDKSNYNNVYTDSVAEYLQQADKMDILNHLHQKFNIDRPSDFEGHSLSVGDVVALKIDGEVSPHFVDSFGFKEVPFFDTKKLEMEMSAEPTANNFLADLMTVVKDNPQTVVDALINNLDTRDKLSNIIALCDLKQELYEVHSFDDVVSLQGFCKDLSYKYEDYPLETITDFAVKAINDNKMPIADLVNLNRREFMDALLNEDTESLVNPLETAEKSLEQNYNQIDGVINNEPSKPTVKDLEQQVSDGKAISITDLANAVNREKALKKPSVLKALKEINKTDKASVADIKKESVKHKDTSR